MKQSLLVEADGCPLGIVVAGANVPDAQLLAATIDAVVLQRPQVEEGYDGATGWGGCINADYQPPIALIRDARPERPYVYKPRRLVVERRLAWLSMYRSILVRSEKKSQNDLAMLKLACGLIWFRHYYR